MKQESKSFKTKETDEDGGRDARLLSSFYLPCGLK
jgi:hypothetical protein